MMDKHYCVMSCGICTNYVKELENRVDRATDYLEVRLEDFEKDRGKIYLALETLQGITKILKGESH